jgi:hypothetical protein
MTGEDPRDDPDEALRLIREIHTTGGHWLSNDEVVDFIKRPMLIVGGCQPIPWSGKGRKPTKTV